MIWPIKLLTGARNLARTFPWWAWASIAAVIVLLSFGGYCAHRAAQGERDRQAVETAKTERRASTGRETASDERLNDELTIRDRQQELTDAVQALPDDVPSRRRVALACQRLRHQRVAERDLPEPCRPDGGTQAPAGAGSGVQ